MHSERLKTKIDSKLKLSFDLEYNSESNDWLILIHGNSSQKSIFQNLIKEVRDHFNIIAIDLPGHGQSQKRETYSIPLMAESINELIKELKIERVHVLGHSLGGHVAIHLSELIEFAHLVLVGCPPLSKNCPLSDIYDFNAKEAMLYCMEDIPKHSDLTNLYNLAVHKNEAYSQEQFIKDFCQTDPLFRTKLIDSISRGEFIDEVSVLKKSRVPITILYGEQDKQVVHRHINSLDGNQIQVIKIKDASHFSPILNPKAVNKSLLEKRLNTVHSTNQPNREEVTWP